MNGIRTFRFSLITLLWWVTFVAFMLAIYTRLGALPSFLALVVVLAIGIAIFYALHDCSFDGISFAFGDLQRELNKCLMASVFVVGIVFLLGAWTIAFIPFVVAGALKVFWPSLSKEDLLFVTLKTIGVSLVVLILAAIVPILLDP